MWNSNLTRGGSSGIKSRSFTKGVREQQDTKRPYLDDRRRRIVPTAYLLAWEVIQVRFIVDKGDTVSRTYQAAPTGG